MDLKPTLFDFSSDSNFLNLQNKFMCEDDKNQGYNQDYFNEIQRDDFNINYKFINENHQDDYYEIFFFDDFLKTSIKDLSEIEINKIKKRLKDDFLYNELERKNFINDYIARYNKLNYFILGCVFFNDDFKIAVGQEIDYVLNFLHDDVILKNPYPENNKMKIKMKKNDIHILFILLRQAKIIDHPIDADLGRLIDNFFLYYNLDDKEYKEIRRSNKEINDFKNTNKLCESSITRLKDLFFNEDFYIFKH